MLEIVLLVAGIGVGLCIAMLRSSRLSPEEAASAAYLKQIRILSTGSREEILALASSKRADPRVLQMAATNNWVDDFCPAVLRLLAANPVTPAEALCTIASLKPGSTALQVLLYNPKTPTEALLLIHPQIKKEPGSLMLFKKHPNCSPGMLVSLNINDL